MAHFAIILKKTNSVIAVIRVANEQLFVFTQQLKSFNVAPPGGKEKYENKPVTVSEESEQKGIEFLKILLKDGYKGHGLEDIYFSQTSYNSNIRYNYAGINYLYSSFDEAFIAPEPKEALLKPEEEMTVQEKQQKQLGVKIYKEGSWALDGSFKWEFVSGSQLRVMSKKAASFAIRKVKTAKNTFVKKPAKFIKTHKVATCAVILWFLLLLLSNRAGELSAWLMVLIILFVCISARYTLKRKKNTR